MKGKKGRNAASLQTRWIKGGWDLNAFNLQPSQSRIGRMEASKLELKATSRCAVAICPGATNPSVDGWSGNTLGRFKRASRGNA